MRLLVDPPVLRFSDARAVGSEPSQASCHGYFITGFVPVNHGSAEGGRGLSRRYYFFVIEPVWSCWCACN